MTPGNTNNGWTDLLFQSEADHTALATFTAEASLLAGTNRQAVILENFFRRGKAILITAAGILSTTGTPTFLFTNRLGTVQGASDLTGAAVGVSAAITTGSGVSNQTWSMWLKLMCRTEGQGSGNSTLSCVGEVTCNGGFASPFAYALAPTTPPTATWTQTFNGAVRNYLNLSATCGTSSGSNTITCKDYAVQALN